MQLINDAWQAAKSRMLTMHISEDEFHLVRLDESSHVPSYCGIDETARQLLVFRTASRPSIPAMRTNAFDSHLSKRQDNSWLYVIRLLDMNLSKVFDSLCIDLVKEVSLTNGDDDFVRLLKTRVQSWQKLFAATDDGLLSSNQVIGLIGELKLLLDLVQAGYMSLGSAVAAWQGPYGADQDFIMENSAIELKTIRDDIDAVGISSLEQLNVELIENLQLVIFGYKKVAYEDPAGLTLNALVVELGTICHQYPLILRELNSALLEGGYVYNESYDYIRIAIVRKDVFDVGNNFPCLLQSHVPAGIIDAQYKISRQYINPFKRLIYPYGNN